MSRRGFTLIELLVAITLLGLAMSLVGGSLWTAVRVREGQGRVAESEHRARVTREFLRESLRGLALEREGRGELLMLEEDGGGDRLVYSTYGGRVFGWPATLKGVVLFVDRDPATAPTGLVARVLHPVPGGAVEDTLSLLPDAGSLRVRLRDTDGRWSDGWPDASRAPTAVQLRVEQEDADPLATLTLTVRVP